MVRLTRAILILLHLARHLSASMSARHIHTFGNRIANHISVGYHTAFRLQHMPHFATRFTMKSVMTANNFIILAQYSSETAFRLLETLYNI